MKVYTGHHNHKFAFLTCQEAGRLLAADGIAPGCGLRQGDPVLLSYAEDGDEEMAIEEGDSFDPSGWHGIEATSRPFDIEIVHAGSYGGAYGYVCEAVYDTMEEANLNPFDQEARFAYFAKFVKSYITDVLGRGIDDDARFCFEIPEALVSKVEQM